jgi:hypothetical protein
MEDDFLLMPRDDGRCLRVSSKLGLATISCTENVSGGTVR